jgi:hypothetical protein
VALTASVLAVLSYGVFLEVMLNQKEAEHKKVKAQSEVDEK